MIQMYMGNAWEPRESRDQMNATENTPFVV